MESKEITLIVDGNLFARKMFYKFRKLSSQISLHDLKVISASLYTAYSPKVSPKKKKIQEKIIDKNTGKTIKVSRNGRIDGRVSKIVSEEELKERIITVNTGIAYGMVKSLLATCKNYNIKYIVFGFDPIRREGNTDRSKEFRTNLDNAYKANRESQSVNEFYSQLYIAQCILRLLGIEQSWTTNFEADDILHFYAKKVFKKDRCLLLTSDHDLYQLLDKRNSILKIGNKDPLFTLNNFQEEFMITPKEYKDSMCLSGCSGDNVKGIKGIANEAINLIRTFGSLKNLIKNFEKSENIKPGIKKILRKEKKNKFKTILLTRKLISLYGLNEEFQENLVVKKHIAESNYKDLIFLLRILKFKSLLGEKEKKAYKQIIKRQKGEKGYDVGK